MKIHTIFLILVFSVYTYAQTAVLSPSNNDEFDVLVPEDSELNSFTVRVVTEVGQFWRSFRYCTGVLIRKDLVITASHCINRLPYNTKYGNLPKVFIGSLENVEEIYVKRLSSMQMPRRLIGKEVYYQLENENLSNFLNRIMGNLPDDLVVLHLATPSSHAPVKILPQDHNINLSEASFILPGFPYRARRATNSEGQQLPLNTISSRDCSLLEVLNVFDDAIITNCFMSVGNSGGPLLVKSENEIYLVVINLLVSTNPDMRQILGVHANLNSPDIQQWLENLLNSTH